MPRHSQAGVRNNEQYDDLETESSALSTLPPSPLIANLGHAPDDNSSISASSRPSPQPRAPQPGPSTSAPSSRVARRRKQVVPYKKAIREIKFFQRTTHQLIPRAPFSRVVREVLQSHGEFRITPEAFSALQESAEIYLTHLFEDAYRCTLFRRAVTLHPRDIQLVQYIRRGLPL